MATRILVSVSGPRNIPYFAMGQEDPEPRVTARDVKDVLSHVIGGDRARIFLEQHASDSRAVEIRFSEGKSAYYSTWLEFGSDAAAQAFATMKPKAGLEQMRSDARAKSDELTAKQNRRLESGFYDLGKLEPKLRTERARDFLDCAKDAEKLSDQLLALDAVERRRLGTWNP